MLIAAIACHEVLSARPRDKSARMNQAPKANNSFLEYRLILNEPSVTAESVEDASDPEINAITVDLHLAMQCGPAFISYTRVAGGFTSECKATLVRIKETSPVHQFSSFILYFPICLSTVWSSFDGGRF